MSYFTFYYMLPRVKARFYEPESADEEKQQKEADTGRLGGAAAQLAGCYLTEAESQSRCGRDLYIVDCSGVCSRHQHGVE